MASPNGWADPAATMGDWAGQDNDDGIIWEAAIDTEGIEPGRCPSEGCNQPALVSGLVPASMFGKNQHDFHNAIYLSCFQPTSYQPVAKYQITNLPGC